MSVRPRVLVVDDESDVLMLMSTSLDDAGFEVITAKDVPSAKKLLLSEIPDLIITDLMMPEESGFSFLGYVRQNPATKATPIIVTSVMDSENESMQAGAEAFLPKPFSTNELVDLVKQLVGREGIPQMMERAFNLIKSKNYQEAEAILQQILKSGTEGTYPSYAAFYLGEITRISGNLEEAENFYKLAVQHGPDSWRAYNELGNIYYSRHDYHRTIAYYKRSLAINPDQAALKETLDRLQKEVVSKNE